MKPASRFLLTLAFCFPIALLSTAAERQLVTGHVPAAVAAAPLIRPLAPDRQLNLAIGLPLRNRETLTNLLQSIYDPASPQFRRYLTPAQFAEQFGPTEADYQAVKTFAVSRGLTVMRSYSNRALLDVRGSVAAINQAFHLTLSEYQHPSESRTFFAPDVEPSLDLSVPVLHIAGLDNFTLPRPLLTFKPLDTNAPRGIGQDGTSPGGFYFGKDFRAAYAPGVTLNGAGQNIGLFELDGYFPQDITAYENLAGLPHVPVTNILIGVNGAPGSQTVEVSLDIEMVASVVTNAADIYVYEGDSPDDILAQMASDNIVSELSCSWTFAIDSSTIQTYQQFDLQGVSVFTASGDDDAYPSTPLPPTDVPYLTSVGGTTLTTGADGSYESESVWNWGGGEGSSGGISTSYTIPTWQKGLATSANQGSDLYRNIPDVAMIANDVFEIGNNGLQGSVGGTSCAAPLWSAFIAMANQLAASNGLPRVGFINPALYALAKGPSYSADFNDVTIGNNESPSSPTRFVATPGYDLCTGWGSPAGNALIYAIGLPEPLQIDPLSPAPFAGPFHGPFGPASLIFTLTNSSSAPLNWKAGNPPPWLILAPTSGTLTGQTGTTVVGTLAGGATNYVPGVYSSAVWFTNRSDNFAQKRVVDLLVVTSPAITAEPTNENVVEGETATFSVGTAANAQLSYQWWQSNGSNSAALSDSSTISGSASSLLTIANVTSNDAGFYFVVVSNAAGSVISSNAVLSIVPSAPLISVPPSDLTVLPGAIAQFSVSAVGTYPLTYQWQFKGTNLFSEAGTVGATTPSLTVSNISAGWQGAFTVVVSNALGTNVATANLTVVSVTSSNVALNTIASFSGGTGGQAPFGGFMTNRNLPTVFFGTTVEGGADGLGEIYRMTTNGSIAPIFSFAGNNGVNPYATLFLGSDNFLYGVAGGGGDSDDGTIFRLSSSAQLTTLASFDGEDGDFAVGNLFQAKDGNYYGTTLEGGLFGLGNLFRVTSGGVLSNLVSFDSINGEYPSGGLIQDASSNLWGTTENGGFYGLGTIFELTPAGQLQSEISFDGYNGDGPVGGLTLDAMGNMYGATFDGGLFDEGEIFVIFPDGSGEVLYDFTGGSDGANPFSPLVLGNDGNIYGTTENGGVYDLGSVFEISPDGVFQSLASFDGFQGAQPTGAILQFKNSWFGTTVSGGASSLGAAYRLTVSGPLQITSQPADYLADLGGTATFQVATFGSSPTGYQWFKDGTNLNNGGPVSGALSRVLTINNCAASSAGVYSVVVKNSFGAVTSSPALLQVLISTPIILEQPQDLTVLDGETAMFSVQAEGDFPLSYQWFCNGLPLTNNGRIQGATNSALLIRRATNSDSGTYSVLVGDDWYPEQSSNAVLLVTPLVATGYSLQNLHSFGARADGANPASALVQARDGRLYGTTVNGGAGDSGAIYRVTTNGTPTSTSVYSFTGGNDGAGPFAGLVQGLTNTLLYGAASAGGADASGTLFQLSSSLVFTPLYSFTGASDGEAPEGTLVFGPDGNLYGTSVEGGFGSNGCIFVLNGSGMLTTLYSFTNGEDGAFPLSGLTLGQNGIFYGSAYEGGTNGYGSVYSIDTNGNFTVLHNFSGDDGAFPVSSPIQGADGRIYGTAYEGGDGGFGVVFSVSTNGDFTNLFSFDYENGALLNAGLAPARDGSFYGAAQNGGPGGAGGIFRITTNGVWSPILWFNGANGAFPESTPTLAADGYYYGATYYGGTNDVGLLYRFSVPTPPDVTVQPTNIFAALGATANFSVTALSASPLAYQWFFNGSVITNATNSTLTLTDVTATNAGSYFVALNNAGGTVDSATAVLVLISPPLLDNGGFELGNFTGWTLTGATNELSVQTNSAAVHSGAFGAVAAPSASLAFLGQTVATTAGGSYSLSFWVNNTNTTGTAEVSTLWDGAVISDLHIPDTLGWSNLQFVVTATNASSSFAIGLESASSVALDDVGLTAIPSLQSTTVSTPPGEPPQITLQWNVAAGQTYQVQVKDALGDGPWTNLGLPIVTGSGAMDFVDYLTNNQRFYRLLLLP